MGREVLRPVDLRRDAVVLDEPEPGDPVDRVAAVDRALPNYNNRSFYNNEELSRTIQAANSELDPPATATELYKKAQQIIQDDAAGIGLYTQNTTMAVANNLKDVWVEKSQGEPIFSDAYFVE